MGFYMLPEDRVREDAIIAGEHAKRTHVKGLKRNAGGHTAVLINRLRVAIEARAPPNTTARKALWREFSIIDSDKSGAVDLKEFISVVKRYLNGAEKEDLTKLFRTFDTDGNGTISVEEFTDKLLKEAGPHNYRAKEYTRQKPPRPQDAPKPPPSSRPRSKDSQWTQAVKNQAGKTLTTIASSRNSKNSQNSRKNQNSKNNRNNRNSVTSSSRSRIRQRNENIVHDATPSMGGKSRGNNSNNSNNSHRGSARFVDGVQNQDTTSCHPSELESVASSSNLGSRAHSLRWAHRHTDQYKDTGAQPLTRNAIEQHMSVLMIEEMTVQYLSNFRKAVRRSKGKEVSGSSDKNKRHPATVGGGLTERVLSGDAKAASTLVWTMSEFAKQSSSKDKTRLSQKRFQAAIDVFRGNNDPVDTGVARLLWAASGKGKIANFVQRCFPTVKVE